MYKLYFHFYQKTGFINRAIMYLTHGTFSHVSIEIEYKGVFEAIGGRFFDKNGIIHTWDKEANHRGKYKSFKIVTVAIPIEAKEYRRAVAFLKETVNSGIYNYLGALAFIPALAWLQKKLYKFINPVGKVYICSELAAEIYTIATNKNIKLTSISPNVLYEIIITNPLKTHDV